jgi:hypothetical protein
MQRQGDNVKTAHKVALLFGLSFVAGSALAQKVATDYDRRTNFANYQTYAWIASKNPAPDPLWNQRIIENIDRQLAAKGLTRVDAAADLYVTYNGNLRNNTSLQGFGTGGRWMGGNFSINQVTEVEGTLVVELYDGQTEQLVWRGNATETASDKTDKNIAKLEKAVEKLFREYPPQAKK